MICGLGGKHKHADKLRNYLRGIKSQIIFNYMST